MALAGVLLYYKPDTRYVAIAPFLYLSYTLNDSVYKRGRWQKRRLVWRLGGRKQTTHDVAYTHSAQLFQIPSMFLSPPFKLHGVRCLIANRKSTKLRLFGKCIRCKSCRWTLSLSIRLFCVEHPSKHFLRVKLLIQTPVTVYDSQCFA